MISHIEMLQNIYKNVSMGREGIIDVLKVAEDNKFRTALTQQLSEYDKLAEEARELLHEMGENEQELGALPRLSSQLMSSLHTLNDHSPSNIAQMMIKGTTTGVTEAIRDLNDYADGDKNIIRLAQKVLDTEQANIEQMKKFL